MVDAAERTHVSRRETVARAWRVLGVSRTARFKPHTAAPGERAGSEITSSGSSSMRVWGQRPGQPGGSVFGSKRGAASMRRRLLLRAVAALAAITLLSGCTGGIADAD